MLGLNLGTVVEGLMDALICSSEARSKNPRGLADIALVQVRRGGCVADKVVV